ncbi:hypothetical protein Sjap_008038 [Stephania japonica]|uniref:STAS domain-containing protein n=1 Tax=Stephania japonica TaxID=461633 RepID=A0AAP0JP52_9MAGN
MGNPDVVYPSSTNSNIDCAHRVAIPPPKPFFKSFKSSLKETFFPDDPVRQFKNQPASRKLVLGLQYFLPILEWGPRYTFSYFKSDLIAGITIASLAIPQGISYAKLANLPPILGLLGFMGGAATVVCLQQLKGILGLEHFTHGTDLVSVLRSIFGQTHQSKRRPKLFWVSAMAPLLSVIMGSLLVYVTHAEKHGVQVIGYLKKGLNPSSFVDLTFESQHLTATIKTGIIVGVIALAEGIAVGRSFAMFKNYHIDGNKEMIAFGMMNIVGSLTSCYLTAGPFSRSAVNFNAGCKTAVSNIVMAIAVMLTLLFLTPLFHYTPLVVLSSIIVVAMLGVIDYPTAIHLWKVDKFDFIICIAVGSIDTSGISLLEEVKRIIEKRGLKLALANPGSEVMKKLEKSKCLEIIGQDWIYLTVGEAVGACSYMLHTAGKPNSKSCFEENVV